MFKKVLDYFKNNKNNDKNDIQNEIYKILNVKNVDKIIDIQLENDIKKKENKILNYQIKKSKPLKVSLFSQYIEEKHKNRPTVKMNKVFKKIKEISKKNKYISLNDKKSNQITNDDVEKFFQSYKKKKDEKIDLNKYYLEKLDEKKKEFIQQSKPQQQKVEEFPKKEFIQQPKPQEQIKVEEFPKKEFIQQPKPQEQIKVEEFPKKEFIQQSKPQQPQQQKFQEFPKKEFIQQPKPQEQIKQEEKEVKTNIVINNKEEVKMDNKQEDIFTIMMNKQRENSIQNKEKNKKNETKNNRKNKNVEEVKKNMEEIKKNEIIEEQKDMKLIKVYTDGSVSGNGQNNAKGGIGVYFGPNDGRNLSEVFTLAPVTNQRTELYAILKAMQMTESYDKVTIYTDSEYSIKCFTEWIENWIKNGFKNKEGKPVKNLDIIMPIHELRTKYPGKYFFKHVNSHTGKTDPDSLGNEEADKLATKATHSQMSYYKRN
jgi:ribonuclease HI